MDIKSAISAYGTIIPISNNFYNSEEWFLNTHALMDMLLKRSHGSREIFDRLNDGTAQTIKDEIDELFVFNNYKYKHLWDLYVAEYNPLWNVDGTETIERDRKNTGTETHKLSGKDTLEKLGTEKDAHAGYDTFGQAGTEKVEKNGSETDTPEGTQTLAKTGSITEEHSGGVENGRTTFDSASFLGTDKTTDTSKISTTYSQNISGGANPYNEVQSFDQRVDTHSYNQVTEEKSFDGRLDTTTYLSDMTHSFTNRKDEQNYGKQDQRTDNLNEKETIVHTRGGNIGTTMTQQLEEAELSWTLKFNLINMIIQDIANQISYIW